MTTIFNLRLRGYRFDETDGPTRVAIQANVVGGVTVGIAAPGEKEGSAFFTIDWVDVEEFCDALRACAQEAGEQLAETLAEMSATAVIENIRCTGSAK